METEWLRSPPKEEFGLNFRTLPYSLVRAADSPRSLAVTSTCLFQGGENKRDMARCQMEWPSVYVKILGVTLDNVNKRIFSKGTFPPEDILAYMDINSIILIVPASMCIIHRLTPYEIFFSLVCNA